MKKKPHNKKI